MKGDGHLAILRNGFEATKECRVAIGCRCACSGVPSSRRSWRRRARMCCARDLPVVTAPPSHAAVLEGRAGRVAMVRVFLGTVTPDVLAESPEPARFRTARARPFLPPRDPQRGMVVPSLRRTRPRRDRRWAHRISRCFPPPRGTAVRTFGISPPPWLPRGASDRLTPARISPDRSDCSR